MNTAADRINDFQTKVPELKSKLKDWYDEEVASIDGTVAGGAPSGGGGSIVGTTPQIGSKRVVDAIVIAKKILEVPLPSAIIKPGGYDSFDEMVDDLIPKLEKAYVAGLKVTKPNDKKQPETV